MLREPDTRLLLFTMWTPMNSSAWGPMKLTFRRKLTFHQCLLESLLHEYCRKDLPGIKGLDMILYWPGTYTSSILDIIADYLN
ncbi:hypothetical protein AB205_0020010, partial [Aquarana catesbeiana]